MPSNAGWSKIRTIMVRQDILGGIRIAVMKGESLKKAMTTFYNAGYSLSEIEEAARAFQVEEAEKRSDPIRGVQIRSPQENMAPVKNQTQKVSDYSSQEKKPARRIWLFVLIIFLLILIGAILSVILFQEEVMSFLKNL